MNLPETKWLYEESTSKFPHSEYSEVFIPPETFVVIIIFNMCIVAYARYWKKLPENILKLKELFLLRSFHMVQVCISSFYCPFFNH